MEQNLYEPVDYVFEANEAYDYYCMFVASLANQCLNEAVRKTKFKGDFKIGFGMGDEWCEYRGKQILLDVDEGEALWWGGVPDDCWDEDGDGYEQPSELDGIVSALSTILEITNDYRVTSPNDISVDFKTGKIES